MSTLSNLAGISGTELLTSSHGVPHQIESSTDVAKAFESIFASLLVKQMRNTGLGEGLFSGDKSDTLGGLFDLFLGQHLAQGEGLGVAKMVQTYVEAARTP